jgi:two-component system NtrC family sensor kinase
MRLVHRIAPTIARALGPARDHTKLGAQADVSGGDNAGLEPGRGLFAWFRSVTHALAVADEGRPPRRLTWPLRLLLAASLAVPLLLLALAAEENLRLVRLEAQQQVMIEAGQLHEHALSAMQTYALVLAWVDDRIHGLDWDRIEHDAELHRFLSDIETLPQIGVVSITDATGRVRASGHSFPTQPIDVSRLDAFVAQRDHPARIFVGRVHMDQLTHVADFAISRRRSTSDDSFDGVIVVSAKPDYFGDFFGAVSREADFSASLMRSDGSVLVRYPARSSEMTFSSDTPVMQAIAAEPDRGRFWSRGRTDGIVRLYGYQRIEGYPLYVVFGVPNQGILMWWRANLVDYLVFVVPASLGLFCMALFAVRQLQRQKLASWRWRTTAQRLKREMDRRTRAEAELHQAQRMEALGQLTGQVAHDFNNLLTVVQGCLETLNGRQQDEALQARVEMALSTIERGEKLTRQLLTFARREPLKLARVDVNGLLRQMAELLVQTLGKGIRLVPELAPDLWPVDTDAAQLELAVINLVINSRDAMSAGGVLRVRTFNTTSHGQKLAEEVREGEDFVAIEISDTGAGMPPDVLARAFEPFFTSKGPGRGTGLGLSMVYGFARQSGGSASIRSEVGRGTTVTLLLPRAPEQGVAPDGGETDLPAGVPA